jgi:hypothetical protein
MDIFSNLVVFCLTGQMLDIFLVAYFSFCYRFVSWVAQYSVWLRAGRLGDRGSIPGRGERIFLLASVSRPALGSTWPPVQWVLGVLSPGLKCGRCVTLTTPSTSAEVENE